MSDAHFGGIVAYKRSPTLQRILDACNRRADLVIVTNEEHAEYVRRVGGNAFICEDPLPTLSKFNPGLGSKDKSVFFICSFDVDEPYGAVFEAAEDLVREGFTIAVSGDYRKVGIDTDRFPNVRFLGFCSDDEFYEQLFLSEIVMDLTTQENCLLCGAYEAMAAEKPLVTSDTQSLRTYFTSGTVYSAHTKESIVSAIREAYEHRERLRSEIIAWKKTAIAENDQKIEALRRHIARLSNTGVDKNMARWV